MSDDGEDNITSPEQRASGRARPSPQGRPGVVTVEGYHAPRHLVSHRAMPVGGGEDGTPTRGVPGTRGLVGEPVAGKVTGNAVVERRSLAAGLGRTQCPVDRGAGGNRRQSAWPCGARRLPPTRPQRCALEGLGRGPRKPRSSGRRWCEHRRRRGLRGERVPRRARREAQVRDLPVEAVAAGVHPEAGQARPVEAARYPLCGR